MVLLFILLLDVTSRMHSVTMMVKSCTIIMSTITLFRGAKISIAVLDSPVNP